jgi:hypothetical protein
MEGECCIYYDGLGMGASIRCGGRKEERRGQYIIRFRFRCIHICSCLLQYSMHGEAWKEHFLRDICVHKHALHRYPISGPDLSRVPQQTGP